MTVDERIQSQTIRPAGGEVNDINLWIITRVDCRTQLRSIFSLLVCCNPAMIFFITFLTYVWKEIFIRKCMNKKHTNLNLTKLSSGDGFTLIRKPSHDEGLASYGHPDSPTPRRQDKGQFPPCLENAQELVLR